MENPNLDLSLFQPPSIRDFKSLIMDNILWMISGFLMVSGAIYFIYSFWIQLPDEHRILITSFGLSLLAGLAFVATSYFNRYHYHKAAYVLCAVAAILTPLSFSVLMLLQAYSWQTVVLIGIEIYGMGWLIHRSSRTPLSLFHLLLLQIYGCLGLSFPFLPQGSAIVVYYLGIGILVLLMKRLFAQSLFVGSTVILIGLWSSLSQTVFWLILNQSWVPTISLVSMFAPTLVIGVFILEYGTKTFFTNRNKPSQGYHWIHVIGDALTICGVIFSFYQPYALLLASTLATWRFWKSGTRFQQPILLALAYGFGLLAYFLSPQPIKELLFTLRDSAATALGYSGNKLPYAYYGLTFFPYLTFLFWLAYRFYRRSQTTFYVLTKNWITLISLGLLGMACFTTNDLRAPLMIAPLFALGYFAMAYYLDDELAVWLSYLSLNLTLFAGIGKFFPWLELYLAITALTQIILWYALQAWRRYELKTQIIKFTWGSLVWLERLLLYLGTILLTLFVIVVSPQHDPILSLLLGGLAFIGSGNIVYRQLFQKDHWWSVAFFAIVSTLAYSFVAKLGDSSFVENYFGHISLSLAYLFLKLTHF